MKTNVADTSVMAYQQLRFKNTQTSKIYDYVEDYGSATIAMIANKLGMEKSTTSARVNAMVNGIKRGDKTIQSPTLELSHRGKCPITGVTAKFWRVRTEREQIMLWDDIA